MEKTKFGVSCAACYKHRVLSIKGSGLIVLSKQINHKLGGI